MQRSSQPDSDSASNATSATYHAAACGSESLKLRLEYAFAKQAEKWGIRVDQTRALLMDRVAVA